LPRQPPRAKRKPTPDEAELTHRLDTRGDRVIAFIETYCHVPEGSRVGQLMVLDDFEKRFIHRVYDNPKRTRRGILSIGKKNGKTALIACLVLAHLAGPEAVANSQIVSGAQARKQAALVFNLAVKIIAQSPQIADRVRVIDSTKTLIGLSKNVEYKALAAEAKTTQGISPVLAILDELGQVKGQRDPFVNAITTSQGAYSDPLLLVISTQAESDEDLLSVWIDDALSGEDPHAVCELYAAPPDASILDEAAWRAANPASFRSFEDIRDQAHRAARMPSFEPEFRNLILNQRVDAESDFISADLWDENGGEPGDFEAEVYGGLDLSSRVDLTAFVLVGPRLEEQIWDTRVICWAPEDGLKDRIARDRIPYDVWAKRGLLRLTPGRSVDYEIVARDVAEACSGLNLAGIAFDRWRMDILKKELGEIDFDLSLLIPFGQGFKDMTPAIDLVETELLNRRVRHGMHPALRFAALRARVLRERAGNGAARKLTKKRQTDRIDPFVAFTMALGATQLHAGESENAGPMPDDYELLTV
jgi:phage terminase large subunit-like protein